ncbi:MAG: hypothetical protein KKD94_05015 [Nanoarchaeota archaeon]|nr:hypothetical protein [Nanoarchaeota archaeon]MBU1988810.1 hypothetical protein [Nanoarchaeota archaeon]
MKTSRVFMRTAVVLGLAGVLLAGSPGCTTKRPILNERGEVIGYKRELDKGKTMSAVGKGIKAGVTLGGIIKHGLVGEALRNSLSTTGSALDFFGNSLSDDQRPVIVNRPEDLPPEYSNKDQDILVATAFCQGPFQLPFEAKYSDKYGTQNDFEAARFQWTLNGNEIARGRSGQVALSVPGDYMLGLEISMPDGTSYQSERIIKVFPKAE